MIELKNNFEISDDFIHKFIDILPTNVKLDYNKLSNSMYICKKGEGIKLKDSIAYITFYISDDVNETSITNLFTAPNY